MSGRMVVKKFLVFLFCPSPSGRGWVRVSLLIRSITPASTGSASVFNDSEFSGVGNFPILLFFIFPDNFSLVWNVATNPVRIFSGFVFSQKSLFISSVEYQKDWKRIRKAEKQKENNISYKTILLDTPSL